jgi:hypothetical protein
VGSERHSHVGKVLLGQAGKEPNQEQSNSLEEKSSPILHSASPNLKISSIVAIVR